jgi:hypothetical protein
MVDSTIIRCLKCGIRENGNMLKLLVSVEGISCLVIIAAIIAGGINEFIYFRSTCKTTIKGYEDISKGEW